MHSFSKIKRNLKLHLIRLISSYIDFKKLENKYK